MNLRITVISTGNVSEIPMGGSQDRSTLFMSVLKAQTKKVEKPKTYRGRQTVKQLMTQNTKLTNIEVTDQNIKSFERVAKKYNIDFALKKDKSISPPRYMVFFKARDVDVMHAAFKEYSAKELTKSKKPSLRKNLEQSKEKAMIRNWLSILKNT